jgi:hypothetical protein
MINSGATEPASSTSSGHFSSIQQSLGTSSILKLFTRLQLTPLIIADTTVIMPSAEFETAAADVKNLKAKPTNDELLKVFCAFHTLPFLGVNSRYSFTDSTSKQQRGITNPTSLVLSTSR